MDGVRKRKEGGISIFGRTYISASEMNSKISYHKCIHAGTKENRERECIQKNENLRFVALNRTHTKCLLSRCYDFTEGNLRVSQHVR